MWCGLMAWADPGDVGEEGESVAEEDSDGDREGEGVFPGEE